MVRALLIRGMLVGLVAGVLAFSFAYVVGEPWVRDAIAWEEASAVPEPAGAHDDDGTTVSRSVQSTVGLLTGTAATGVALGGGFALVYAFALGRFGPHRPRALAMSIAAGAFFAVALVPFFKYPANPPAVGDPDTVGRRTALYLTLIVVALAATVLVVVLRRRLLDHRDSWTATTLAGGAGLLVIAVGYVVLPAAAEAPAGFPADVLWGFRVASLGVQAVMWTAIGLVYGALTERALAGSPAPVSRAHDLTSHQLEGRTSS